MRTITVKEGLLWEKGEIVGCLEADAIARANGFVYAERIVKAHDGKTLKIDEERKIVT